MSDAGDGRQAVHVVPGVNSAAIANPVRLQIVPQRAQRVVVPLTGMQVGNARVDQVCQCEVSASRVDGPHEWASVKWMGRASVKYLQHGWLGRTRVCWAVWKAAQPMRVHAQRMERTHAKRTRSQRRRQAHAHAHAYAHAHACAPDPSIEVDDRLACAREARNACLFGAVTRREHRARHIEPVCDPVVAVHRPAVGACLWPDESGTRLAVKGLLHLADAALHTDAFHADRRSEGLPERYASGSRKGVARHASSRLTVEETYGRKESHVSKLFPVPWQCIGGEQSVSEVAAAAHERSCARAA